MNKKYIAPQVNTSPLDDITPLMAGSTGSKTMPVSDSDDDAVNEQGAKRNMNPFAPDTDDEQKESIWE